MHDGITFEERGKPATTIVTESFVRLANAKKESMGLKDYQFVVVPHPLGAEGQTREKARLAAPRVVQILLGEE